MTADPILTAEYAVIIACLIFLAWRCLPAQRSKRRREEARRRVAFRRELRARGRFDRDDEPTTRDIRGSR